MQTLEILFILEAIPVLIFLYLPFIGLLAIRNKNEKLKNPHHFPMVSVVVCAWNEEGTIRNCLNSLLKINYPKYEIIVVGGGSDSTAKICQEYTKFSKIRFIFERKRGGKWKSLNKAIKFAKGSIIALLDADATVSENWLRYLTAPLEDNIGISCGRFIVKSTKTLLQKIVYVANGFMHLTLLGFDYLSSIEFASGANMAFKKEIHDKIKFKNVIIEDSIIVMEARNLGYKVRYFPSAVTYYETVGSVKGLNNQIERYTRGAFELVKKSISLSKLTFMTFLIWTLYGFFSLFLIPSIIFAFVLKIYFLLIPTTALIFLFIILEMMVKTVDSRKYPKYGFISFSLIGTLMLFGGFFLVLAYAFVKEIRKRPVLWLTSEKRR